MPRGLLLRRLALLLPCAALCAALVLGGCGLSVKPKGQVATSISVGR